MPSLIKSGNPYLCQAAKDQIRKMSVLEKRNLLDFFKAELNAGPSQIQTVQRPNLIILLLWGSSTQNFTPPEICFFQSIEELNPVAHELIPLLIRKDNLFGFINTGGPFRLVNQLLEENPDDLKYIAPLLFDANSNIEAFARGVYIQMADKSLPMLAEKLKAKLNNLKNESEITPTDDEFLFLTGLIGRAKEGYLITSCYVKIQLNSVKIFIDKLSISLFSLFFFNYYL
ncbi:MAG: hypothetical protein A2Z20_02830 [Bdellovibrionales bacterium RBG_16_40_8]|nr:MAG: hypothetical protein A2Z20_02830 [Bdellovibrionales bacterium RBG_16_40_8]